MSYQVIARKWRPQRFDEIVGQSHITTTLKNAISSGRIGHAFLFTGMRGVGKTTAARILAKALNCEKGPTTEPCNQCKSCLEITQGTSMDVTEIDGASNRGVDNIQNLREGVGFAPVRDRYKIYIIDEIHMLTKEAFNALLKTLEEPPKHVVFIFATTEFHKVPQTIASRCQVFEFKRIPVNLLAERLKLILQSEGITFSEDALRLIAREADGSLRDGASLLDQVIAFSAGNIDVETVREVLRLGGRATSVRALDAILSEDPKEALKIFLEAVDRGITPKQFLQDVARTLADCIKVSLLGSEVVMENGFTELEVNDLRVMIQDKQPEYLAILLNLMVSSIDKMAESRCPDLLGIGAIIRASRLSSLSTIERVITRLENLMKGEVRDEQTLQPTRQEFVKPSTSISQENRVTKLVLPANPVQSGKNESPNLPPRSPSPSHKSKEAEVVDKMKSHPVVQRILDAFGGEIVDIKAERS